MSADLVARQWRMSLGKEKLFGCVIYNHDIYHIHAQVSPVMMLNDLFLSSIKHA